MKHEFGLSVAHALDAMDSLTAIAASGLLQLADLTDEPTRAQRYREYAYTILITLSSPTFLAIETPGWEGILKHGIYHQRKNLGVDESVMWAEYFFVEALERLGQPIRS